MNRICIAVLLLLTVLSVHAQTLIEKAKRDETVHMADEEPAMREAFSKARATLDKFLEVAASPQEGTSGYALKVAVSDGRNTEYFWVNRFANSGAKFTGHLGNEPRTVKRYKFDERFEFDRAQIVDWIYIDAKNRRMHGNFTACALVSKESLAQKQAFMQRYGLACE